MMAKLFTRVPSKVRVIQSISCRSFSTKINPTVFKSTYPRVKVPPLTFPEFLLDEALDRHKELALIDATTGDTMTYGKVKEKVNDLAIHFYIRGWKQGDVLALIMPNKMIYPLTFLAAARVGIPITLVDPTYKSREMVKQLKTCRVAYIITTNQLLPQVRDATASLRGIKEILVLDKEEPGEKKEVRWSIEMKYNLLFGKPPGWGALPDWNITTDMNVCLPFTENGTKGVPLTHAHLSSSIIGINNIEKDIATTDVFLSTLPYHNIFNILLAGTFPFFKGAKSVVMETYELPRFLEIIQQHKVTYAHISPAHLNDLVKDPIVDNYDLTSLSILLVSDYVDIDVINKVQNRLKNVKVKQAYSMCDLTPPVMLSPSSLIKVGSAGVLVSDTEAKLIDPSSNKELDVNAEGDLYIKGAQIMTDYYNNPDATKEGFDSKKFVKTGDRARVDSDGYWWILPRPKQEDVVES